MLIHTLNKKECGDLLRRLGFGRLGCASENQPYVVPTYFAYEPDRLFGFSMVGQKIEWMRENPLVCVEADEVIDHDNWASVLVLGRYQELADEPKYAVLQHHAYSQLEKRAQWARPALASAQTRDERFGPCPVFYCIQVGAMTGKHALPDQGQ
jgi:nitroimidazol reductase NimA-like FMN-containing flavoprotein (pyridoxamine 5'-phosphate oxidase superfamily)